MRDLPVAELCDRLLDDLRVTPAVDDVAVLCLRTVASGAATTDGTALSRGEPSPAPARRHGRR
jgi:hypothetical protein